MRIKNTSRFPDDEVRELVEFGMQGVRTARLAVNVKNATKTAYRGMAYEGVPCMSPASNLATVDRLVTISIGPDAKFPCDNRVQKWVEETQEERDAQGSTAVKSFKLVDAGNYGGKGSPLIVFNDWREALVGVAAHEARHVQQQQRNKRRSEVDAERFAAKRLEEYRKHVSNG